MPQRPIRQFIADQQIFTAPKGATVRDAAQLMKESHVGAVMVVELGRLVGIFTERDAVFRVIAQGRDVQTTTLAEVMTPQPLTLHPDKPLGHALHLMYEGGFRHVPVVENGRPVGMISARDALELEAAEFEEALARREHISVVL